MTCHQIWRKTVYWKTSHQLVQVCLRAHQKYWGDVGSATPWALLHGICLVTSEGLFHRGSDKFGLPKKKKKGAKQWLLGSVKKSKMSLWILLIKVLRLTVVIMMSFPQLVVKLHLSSCQASLYLSNNEHASSLKHISPASLPRNHSKYCHLPDPDTVLFCQHFSRPFLILSKPHFSACTVATQQLLFLKAGLSKQSTAGINNQLLLSFSSEVMRRC